MSGKVKRWRGNTYILKQDISPTTIRVTNPNPNGNRIMRGLYPSSKYTFYKGQTIYDLVDLKDLFDIYNPMATPKEEEDFIESMVETVPNKWWKTTMKFTNYVHTHGNPRMTAVDIGTRVEYHFSWSDFWSIFNNIERGEITGIFTLKKHGGHVTARMIVTDEEKQAIDNGTW